MLAKRTKRSLFDSRSFSSISAVFSHLTLNCWSFNRFHEWSDKRTIAHVSAHTRTVNLITFEKYFSALDLPCNGISESSEDDKNYRQDHQVVVNRWQKLWVLGASVDWFVVNFDLVALNTIKIFSFSFTELSFHLHRVQFLNTQWVAKNIFL